MLLASRGARILVVDRDEDGSERVVAAIRDAGGEAEAHSTDLASAEKIESAAQRILASCGPPEILINVAGWDLIGPFVEVDDVNLELLVRVNLIGPMRLTRAVPPGMLESDPARRSIVNVASDAGRVGSSGETVYAGAKGGIIAFTKSLARASLIVALIWKSCAS
jgi:2-hydroxycyclohexanecarboxyl-CoA dehydrogenase